MSRIFKKRRAGASRQEPDGYNMESSFEARVHHIAAVARAFTLQKIPASAGENQ